MSDSVNKDISEYPVDEVMNVINENEKNEN